MADDRASTINRSRLLDDEWRGCQGS